MAANEFNAMIQTSFVLISHLMTRVDVDVQLINDLIKKKFCPVIILTQRLVKVMAIFLFGIRKVILCHC